jgi:hypothetical protein
MIEGPILNADKATEEAQSASPVAPPNPVAEKVAEHWDDPIGEGFNLDPEPAPEPEFSPTLSAEDRKLSDNARARWPAEQAQQAAEQTAAQYAALNQQALDLAVERFDLGEEHPAEILAELQENPAIDPQVAQAFHAMWAADDEGYDIADPTTYPVPETAEEYAENLWQQAAYQQEAAQQAQAQAMQAARQGHWQGLVDAAPSAVQKAMSQMPADAGRLTDLAVEQFAGLVARGIVPNTPGELETMVEGSYRTAAELDRVYRAASTKADLQEDISVWQQGWLPDGSEPEFERPSFVAEEMAGLANVARVVPPASRAEREAAARATLGLDERERALADAFRVEPSAEEKARADAPKTARGASVGYRPRGRR